MLANTALAHMPSQCQLPSPLCNSESGMKDPQQAIHNIVYIKQNFSSFKRVKEDAVVASLCSHRLEQRHLNAPMHF